MKRMMTMGIGTAKRYLDEGRTFDAGAMLGRLVPLAVDTNDGESLKKINLIAGKYISSDQVQDLSLQERSDPERFIGRLLDVALDADNAMYAGLCWGQARVTSLLNDLICSEDVEDAYDVLTDGEADDAGG